MWVNTGTRGKQRQIQILGFTNNTYDENKANPWNPMARIKTIDGIDYYDISVPIKMTYGTADEVLPDNQYFKRLAQAMINAKATVYCKWYTGFDHMDVAFANEDVVKKDTIDFFDRF